MVSGPAIAKVLTPVRIEEELRSSYLDYAMSVIVARALPDVRDGLKPVQRRILYAMQELGLRPGAPYKKSARIVGEVLGKYHPHGDAPVYEAMVRMAQDFTLRYPLVDGQGNFGSIDDDPPAAMRYTEARLAPIAEEMLADIDRDTVDFVLNFDGSLQEPAVLPARLPNLLVNGASGIAVGMATSIPPHNLAEVCDAIVRLIDDPDTPVEDLLGIVQGPDFPTGGIVLAGAGRQSLLRAYATGQGRILVRGKAQVVEPKKGRPTIVITEVPYQVNKAALVERIATLAREKKIEGIAEVRDESDREGLRVVVELKREAQADIVLNNLYKHTPLQSAFTVHMLALVEGQPRVLSLKEMLGLYIQHRQQVVTRRAQHDLRKAQERAHILEGLRIALQFLDEVIRIIRQAPDADTARQRLMERFGLTQVQAQAILDMQLRRLTALDRQKLEEEYQALRQEIERLQALLADPRKILAEVRRETLQLKKDYGDARRTQVLAEEVRELSREELVPHAQVVVTLSANGYIKRIPVSTYHRQHRAGKGVKGMLTREDDAVRHLVVCDTHDTLLLFSKRGWVYALKVYDIPEDTTRATRGTPLANLVGIGTGEAITSVRAVSALGGEAFLLLCTRQGEVKRIPLAALASVRTAGLVAMDLEAGDELVSAQVVGEEDEVVLVTRRGKALRTRVASIPQRSRQAGGVRGIRLAKDDQVVAMEVVRPGGELLVVSAQGFGKRTPLDEFRPLRRGRKGIATFAVSDKTGPVALARVVPPHPEADLVVATAKAHVLRTTLGEVPTYHRDSRGARIIALEEGDSVASLAVAWEEASSADRG
ncbi:MAG: DNA gyrase subunit A [Dehalococcoidia bacterium]|nr:DNA gyrase subunit A [Dehalococcoidia bacterium]